MDLNQLSLFIALVEAGGLSEAARRTGTAKSNLSRALSSLESELQTALIYRNTRNFKPTEAGVQLYDLIRGPILELKNASEVVKRNEIELKGRLSLTMSIDMAHTVMPEILMDFSKAYPQIELDLRAEDRIVDIVKEGVDLAIRASQLRDSQLKAVKICDISLVLVASPQYLSTHGKNRMITSLEEHRLILFNDKLAKKIKSMVVKKPGREVVTNIGSSIFVNSPLMAKSFAVNGHGIAAVPDLICYNELKNGDLIRVLPEKIIESSALHYVWSPNAKESGKVRAFIDFSKERLRNNLLTGRY